jgi:hypothetical protein
MHSGDIDPFPEKPPFCPMSKPLRQRIKRRPVPLKDATCKRCCDTGEVPNPADPYSLHLIVCPDCGGEAAR